MTDRIVLTGAGRRGPQGATGPRGLDGSLSAEGIAARDQAIDSAAAALQSEQNAAAIVGIPSEAAAQTYNINNDAGVRSALVDISGTPVPTPVRYVAVDGSNGNAGRTPGLAFRSIQAAIDTLTDGGKIVVLPSNSGTYEPFVHSGAKLSIEGWGGRGQDTQTGLGAVRIMVGSGQIGANINAGGANHFKGPVIKNLHFVGSAGALAGIRLGTVSDFILDDVCVSDFDAGGWGIEIVGGNASQYGTIRNPQINDCMRGLRVGDTNGLRVFGGLIENLPSGSSIIPGSIGVQVDAQSDSAVFYGMVTQFLSTCYDISSENVVVDCPRVEAFSTGIIFRGNRGTLNPGGRFNNFIHGSGGQCVQVASTATRTRIYPFAFGAVGAEPVLDQGVNTHRLDGVNFDRFLASSITTAATEPAAFVPRSAAADSFKLRNFVLQTGETNIPASGTDYWTVVANRRGGGSNTLQTINSQAGWAPYSRQAIDLLGAGGSDQTFNAGDRVHLSIAKTGNPPNLTFASTHGIFVPR